MIKLAASEVQKEDKEDEDEEDNEGDNLITALCSSTSDGSLFYAAINTDIHRLSTTATTSNPIMSFNKGVCERSCGVH